MRTLGERSESSWLPWFLRGLSVLSFLLLFIKLAEIQIIKGDYYKSLSNGNRIRRVRISAPRGKIFDSYGKAMADNKEIKKIIVFDEKQGYKKIEKNAGQDVEGDIISEWTRYYPQGPKMSHLTGYVGEISEDELGRVDSACIEKGTRSLGLIEGKSGLEATYDCLLRGIDGEELIEVDTRGRKVRTLGIKPVVPGKDLVTYINFDLQIKVADSMRDKTGSVVVTDTEGKILAYYSSPSYDPDAFTDKLRQPEIKRLLNDTGLPLYDRVIQGTYHPGSTYKILVSLAGLENGTIDENYVFNDEGIVEIKTPYGNYSYANWYYTQYGGREGQIGIKKAIGRSTDTFFYKLGELIGVDELVNWSNKLKLGEKTGIDLPGEADGLIPSPIWKEREKNEKWFLGNTYHMAIGQGDLALTPLQVNVLTNVIASGGKVCSPTIAGNEKCKDLGVDKKSINIIREGMEMVCMNGGTAYPFFNFHPIGFKDEDIVACKTGTAETGKKDISHAWFTMFYPSKAPQIVITVFVEEGGEGSKVAAPIAREIMDYWTVITK